MSAGIGLVIVVAYLAIVLGEKNDAFAQAASWAAAIAVATALAAAAAVSERYRRPLMFAAGGLFILTGLPAISSVGLPLLAAGALCVFAAPGRAQP